MPKVTSSRGNPFKNSQIISGTITENDKTQKTATSQIPVAAGQITAVYVKGVSAALFNNDPTREANVEIETDGPLQDLEYVVWYTRGDGAKLTITQTSTLSDKELKNQDKPVEKPVDPTIPPPPPENNGEGLQSSPNINELMTGAINS